MSNVFKNSKLVKNVQRDLDKRGQILSLVNTNIQNVSIIKCNKNSIRSNHYHKKDWHYMYVLEGRINYFYKKINSSILNYKLVNKGDNIFTPPKEIHATHFPVKTILIVCSKNKRNKTNYEKDTVRIELININNLKKILTKK